MNNAYLAVSVGIILVALAPWLLFGIGFFAAVGAAIILALLLFGGPFVKDIIKNRHFGAKSGMNPRDLASAPGNQHDGQEDS